MTIWSGEIKELEILYESFKGNLPDLGKELYQLIKTQDANVVMLYSRRCLEVIITDLCEWELKRPRKTEPLKGIIDKLNSEEKVPSHIITSMLGLNSLSTYGAHPKDFDPEQVKPALNNLAIVIKWYLKYRESRIEETHKPDRSKNELSDIKGTNTDTSKYKKKQKSIIITIGLVALAGLAITIIYFATKGSDSYANLEKSIAVLPFRNDSSDDSTRYFMDGVMEELLTKLQSINDIRVISRTSVEQYRDHKKSIPIIASELGVNYIVEGSGQKSGSAFRMRIQLIRAKKESHLWAKSFENENLVIREYFNVQTSFAEEIARELSAVITPLEKQMIEKIPTVNLDAYEAYLNGQFSWRKLTPDGLDAALQYFERAKEIDPNYALAYAGICDVWIGRQQAGYSSPEIAGPKAFEAAMKALELDSTRAEVHYTLALMYTWGMFDWGAGERSFKKAINLKPNYPEARLYYSHLLNFLGREDEAKIQGETGIKQDPANSLILGLYSGDLLFFRQFDEAVKMSQDALRYDPSALLANNLMAWAYFNLGKYSEAFNIFKEIVPVQYDVNNVFDQKITDGDYLKALHQVADGLVKLREKSYVLPFDIAVFYTMSGDHNNALGWLEKAIEERDPNIPYLRMPLFDKLRDDPRFKEIALKLKLPYK